MLASSRKAPSMSMEHPPHPGYSIRQNRLDPLGLNVNEVAKVLGVANYDLQREVSG